tara:strand:- start:2252 stop:4291 length:2040 start_codon:yes stop_codon:yes gene_type:complete
MKFKYASRELSLLSFNDRVLSQAINKKIPLLERFKFACIVSSNLDEFYEIRYAELLTLQKSNKKILSRDNFEINKLLLDVGIEAKKIKKRIQKLLYEDIIPALEKEKIYLITDRKWLPHLDKWTENLFKNEIEPLVTPIVISKTRPFPNIINKTVSYIAELQDINNPNSKRLAVIQMPHFIPRVFQVPYRIAKKTKSFIFIGGLMRAYMQRLFPDYKVIDSYQFKLTRNVDLFISEDADDIRSALKGGLTTRNLGEGVRLEISTRMPKRISNTLAKIHNIRKDCIFSVRGPSNLYRFVDLGERLKYPELKFPKIKQKRILSRNMSSFEWIKISDRLLHHPYDTFDPVIHLIEEAAKDPEVLTIKQTIYRTGNHSPIMEALMLAAQNGKEVTVVIELMARFDEQTNVNWSAKLESVGAHVVHSRPKRKCHAKMLLITRRELNTKINKFEIKSYGHLGTGNYSPKNAKTYTDFSFFTTDKYFCKDINKVFSFLVGSSNKITLKKLWHDPTTHRTELKKLIRKEIRNFNKTQIGHIIIKVNSLVDHEMINLLYQASLGGVQVDLIVRGMCSLRVGESFSKNINVYSVIGRYLEHHRIFYFKNNGEEKLYLSSADWMERNLSRRIEVSFPIEGKKLIDNILNEGLNIFINGRDSWKLKNDYSYDHKKLKKHEITPQEEILLTR